MSEFVKNYFLSPKTERTSQIYSKTPNFIKDKNKKDACCYLEKIIFSKIKQQFYVGFSNIICYGIPKQTLEKHSIFTNNGKNAIGSENKTNDYSESLGSLKDSISKGQTYKTTKLLKKISSLNQIRTISTLKKDESQWEYEIINPQRISVANKINKQSELQLMNLSDETRNILQKLRRENKQHFSSSFQQLCKDQFQSQVIRLQKNKNKNKLKNLRGIVYDNQLTMQALYNSIKIIGQLNKQLQYLKKQSIQEQRQLRKKNQQQIRLFKSAEKVGINLDNIQFQMNKFKIRIQQHLTNRQLIKAQNAINDFVRKYEGQKYSKQSIYFYKLIKDRIIDAKQMKKCLDEVGRILGVLCIADLNQTDGCLRSLSANHTAFKYIKRTYGNVDKIFGKQMLNILHNLQNFNNNIIKYLQAKKQIQKLVNKPTGVEELKKQHNIEINNLHEKMDKHRRKIALLEVDIQRKNFKINNIDLIINSNENCKKVQVQFQKFVADIVQKINNNKQYGKQLQNFRKNSLFFLQKPYSQFINLIFALQRGYNQRNKGSISNLSKTFNDINKVFRKKAISQQAKLKQIHKIFQNSTKNNLLFCDLHILLQSLIFTIVQTSKQQKYQFNSNKQYDIIEQKQIQKLEDGKKSRRFSENFYNFKSQFTKIKDRDNSKDSLLSVCKSNQFLKIEGSFDSKQALKISLEIYLNQITSILHLPNTEMQDKLAKISQLSQSFSQKIKNTNKL